MHHLTVKSRRKLVLASSSPRRKDILSSVFSEFVIDPPRNPEKPLDGAMAPAVAVLALAKNKAEEVALRHDNALVIGCDTCVWTGSLVGKPADRGEAEEMLKQLSGVTHKVFSGLWVVDTLTKESRHAVEQTDVSFDDLSDEDIEFLLSSEEYVGKAGGYAIQGLTGLFIRGIKGDYNNVVGLPLHTLYRLLKELGM